MFTSTKIDFPKLNQFLDIFHVLLLIDSNTDPIIKGQQVRAFCPIHKGDSQRSLAINLNDKSFFCHSCSAKGRDLISLYAQSKNISQYEAAEYLQSSFNIDLSTIPSNNLQEYNLRNKIIKETVLSLSLWEKAQELDEHPYLTKKQVATCKGLKHGADEKGNPAILVPFTNINGKITAIEYINEHIKLFATGSKRSGSFFVINNEDYTQAKKAYIAEGIATALTIYKATKNESYRVVVSCGPVDNMLSVIEAIKSHNSNLEIVACPDNDKPGKNAAQKILQKSFSNIHICMPNFDGLEKNDEDNDFNDLQRLVGIETVKEQLQNNVPQILNSMIKPAIEAKSFDQPLTTQKEMVQHEIIADNIGLVKPCNILETIKQNIQLFKDNGNKSVIPGISTGYAELDDTIGGFQKGHLITLAGRSGHGKSWIILNFIINISINQKIPSLLISLEMSKEQVEYRLLSLLTGISTKIMRNGSATEQDLQKIENAYQQISTSPIHIEDDMRHDKLNTLSARIKQAHKDKIKFIVIDHIGLVHKSDSGSYSDNRVMEVAGITRTIKSLTKLYKLPILICAQLNREADTPEKPKGSQLRESDTLKQDSDIVFLVHRPEKYNEKIRPYEFDIIIDKNRDGEELTIPFTYQQNSWGISEKIIIKNDNCLDNFESMKQKNKKSITNESKK